MPGLVPGIHDLFLFGWNRVDGRVKPGHDAKGRITGIQREPLYRFRRGMISLAITSTWSGRYW